MAYLFGEGLATCSTKVGLMQYGVAFPAMSEETLALEVTPLSSEERAELRQLELRIEKTITGFIECGRALLRIREQRLFRGQYKDFSEYVRLRWGLARSTADQLCRSTQVYETLVATTGAPDSDTPVAANVPEIVLRPIARLPDSELQAQTWRLAALTSPNGQPTRTITAKVSRLVAEAAEGSKNGKPAKERDVMFTQPILRLSKITTFNADLACLHVQSFVQGASIHVACAEVVSRCQQIMQQLEQKFPELCPSQEHEAV